MKIDFKHWRRLLGLLLILTAVRAGAQTAPDGGVAVRIWAQAQSANTTGTTYTTSGWGFYSTYMGSVFTSSGGSIYGSTWNAFFEYVGYGYNYDNWGNY